MRENTAGLHRKECVTIVVNKVATKAAACRFFKITLYNIQLAYQFALHFPLFFFLSIDILKNRDD